MLLSSSCVVTFLQFFDWFDVSRFGVWVRRSRGSYDDNMVTIEEQTPHTFMEASDVQVPYVLALGHWLPHGKVAGWVHFYVDCKHWTLRGSKREQMEYFCIELTASLQGNDFIKCVTLHCFDIDIRYAASNIFHLKECCSDLGSSTYHHLNTA